MHRTSHFLGFVICFLPLPNSYCPFFMFKFVAVDVCSLGHYCGGVYCMSAATVLHKTCKLMIEECVMLDA